MNREPLDKVLSGDATTEEIGGLRRAAADDPLIAQAYARHQRISALLSVALENEAARNERCGRVMDALRDADSDAFVDRVRDGIISLRWRRFAIAAAAAAAVLLAVAVPAVLHRSTRDPACATLVRAESVDWGGRPAFTAGSGFRQRDVIQLSSGLLELEMGGRGRMIIEGPARLVLTGADSALLERGRLVMKVTPHGHGYQVNTPDGGLVDLGTEFGVSVNDMGRSEIHVLQGEVIATPKGGAEVVLKRNEAIRFGNGGGRIPADGADFYTQLPPRREPDSHYIHWPLDRGNVPFAQAIHHGLPEGADAMNLRAIGKGPVPQWTGGVFGGGLEFDGKGAYAESNFPGIGGGHPRTVCLWVKVPEDFSQQQGFGLISWGRFRDETPGSSWQIAINPLEKDGPVGRLRVGTHGGNLVGTTDLTDGRWHHIGVVLYGGTQVDVGTHVLVYIDGVLEPVSRRALRGVNTDITTAGHGVWLGRNLTYERPGAWWHVQGGFFRGAMDEVYIFDSALSRDDLIRLRDHNSPP